ncbi:unnamed protein product [Cuscuta campestris]|uniref:F-box associated beta-propeller type 3 domain-containing protein n=1 Tax=Cuscuta campestris TaxID=132261 RepID=A0A484NC32_9ASTE|nr:unnamed protein product [Cuscuta campestris]
MTIRVLNQEMANEPVMVKQNFVEIGNKALLTANARRRWIFGLDENQRFIWVDRCVECTKRDEKSEAAIACTRSWCVLTRHKHKLSKSDSDTANITFPRASLPEHLIFRILTFLPAHVLHNVAIHVCWSWYRLVKTPIFTRDNLIRTPSFLSFNTYTWCEVPSELHLQTSNSHSHGPKLQITRSSLPLCCKVLATCNGLVLAKTGSYSEFALHLANPVTGENISNFPELPEIPAIQALWLPNVGYSNGHVAGISYMPSLDAYKVVLIPCHFIQPVLVLTLGTDAAWRFVDSTTAKVNGSLRLNLHEMHFPISIDGYIYWTNNFYPSSVLVFEAESEKLFYIPSPTKKMISSFLMSNGWLGVAEFEGLSNVQIWALTNVALREWTQMFTITTRMGSLFPRYRGAFNKFKGLRKAQLIHCSTSGEVTLVYFSANKMAMYWHDVTTGAYEAVVHNRSDVLYFYSRVESLISPKSIPSATH